MTATPDPLSNATHTTATDSGATLSAIATHATAMHTSVTHATASSPRCLGRLAPLLRTLVALLLAAPVLAAAPIDPATLAEVPGGTYLPFYPVAGEGPVLVDPFTIQTRAVSNAEFQAFVATHSAWERGAPPAVFADPGYLAHWAGPAAMGDADPRAPVTNVSWFAAGAYCSANGMRLPTEAEWEHVARADATRADASDDPVHSAELLAAYGRRGGPLAPVGSGKANLYGVADLHGSVWEWVEDPWGVLATNDSRNAGDDRIALVCGGASLGARDRTDYPAFLRHATRAGLDAASVGSSLGFRCAI